MSGSAKDRVEDQIIMASKQRASPPRSILKKTKTGTMADEAPPSDSGLPVPKTDAEKRRLAVAVQRARQIEEQKRIMQANLDAIERLAEFPAAALPTAEETQEFLTCVTPFQPTDYDALIEERQAMGRCGYTLCANPPRKHDAKRPWLRPAGSHNWCSDDCAKRGLYIKAQLDESPAWERWGGAVGSLILYDENKLQASKQAVQQKQASNRRDLALERGERAPSDKIDNVMSSEVMEKKTTTAATAPTNDNIHDVIEGYQPKANWDDLGARPTERDDSDGEDEDWAAKLIP